jgi:hypothetical protein
VIELITYGDEPELALLLEASTRQATYPATGAAFTARTGSTLTSLYLFDESTGDVLDKVGSNTLTTVNTPTYAYAYQGRTGIHYDGDTDAHRADVLALGTGSGLYGAVIRKTGDTTAARNIVQRTNGSNDPCVILNFAVTSGNPQMIIRDAGTNALLVDGATFAGDTTSLLLAMIQVDRSTSTARSLVTDGRQLLELSGSISGYGSLDGTSQTFGFGNRVQLGQVAAFYGFGIVGAGAEGSTRLRDIARGLGWI